MTEATAIKVTLSVYVLGLAAIVYSNRSRPFSVAFKRTWGLSILAAGGCILSDLAPGAVGPYMILVGLGFLYGQKTGLGQLFGAASGATKKTNQPPIGPVGPVGGPNTTA